MIADIKAGLNLKETDTVFASKEVGSRAATRVRVATPQGSAFDGREGVVVSDHPESSTLMVRLDAIAGHPLTVCTLPFGRSELRAI